jgi:hypothetical protein
MSPARRAFCSATIVSSIFATAASTAKADEADPSSGEDVAVSVYQPGLDGSPRRAGEAAPAGCHVERRIRRDLVLTGALLFGIPYALSAVAGLVDPESRRMLIPVAGPVLELSAPREKRDSISTAATRPAEVFVLTMLSVYQGAGAITLILGLALQKEVIVRDGAVVIRATPMRLGESGNGGGLTGSF